MESSSTPQADIQVDTGSEWPTFPSTSAAGKRLRWTLNGPLEESITVAPREYYEPGDVMEPYFQPASPDAVSGALATSLHPVSQEPIIEPKVTSFKVTLCDLKDWDTAWEDLHYQHADHDDPRHWGYTETADQTRYLKWCCGEDRPWWSDATLEVKAAGEFLTVHEYVSAVHPWLMSMRARILDAYWGLREGYRPVPDDTKLFVAAPATPLLTGREEDWVELHGKPLEYPDLGGPSSPSGGSLDDRKARVEARNKKLEEVRQKIIARMEAHPMEAVRVIQGKKMGKRV